MTQTQREWKLREAQFTGDSEGQEAIRANPELWQAVEAVDVARHNAAIRQHFLSTAVRVDPKILPALAKAFQDVRERCEIDQPMEAYVYAQPDINAFVVRGAERLFVVLSSGAVERLTPDELDFIIGHELGHASFGHLDLPVMAVLNGSTKIHAKQAMQLMAWQRKAEISADRAGLLCCGSLQTAATTLFKTLSGLAIEGLAVDPQEFAGQWNDLANEVARQGGGDHWLATHPFPPLRMKALINFWDCERAKDLISDASGDYSFQETEREIESLLAMMDPLARENQDEADPMLRQFFLWGGLYIALANQELHPRELDNIRSVVGRDAVTEVLAEGEPTAATVRERFLAAREERHKPLSALEMHRIFSGLATVAAADGNIDQDEVNAMTDLAGAFGLNESFVDVVLAKAA